MVTETQHNEQERARKALLSLLEDQKLATEKLRKSEERYSLVIEAVDQGLWDWDVKSNSVYFSPLWKKQIGYEDNELENNFDVWIEHLHPDDKDRCINYVFNYLENPIGPFEVEFRFRHKDGSYKYIFSKASKILDSNGKVVRLFGAHSDITQQKLAEIEKVQIQKQKELQQNVLVQTATSEFLRNGDIEKLSKFITEKVAETFSIERVSVWFFDSSDSENELLKCLDLYELSKKNHSSGFVLKKNEYENEFYYLEKNKYVAANDPLTDIRTKGYVQNYLIPNNITAMLDGGINYDGKNIGAICFEHVNYKHTWNSEEINFICQLADQIAICKYNYERKIAEQKLKESEEKYRLIAENTADSIAVFDLKLNYIYLSPSTKNFLGYEIEELKSLGVQKILKPGYYEYIFNQLHEELEKEKESNVDLNRSRTVVSEQIKKDGKIIWVEATVSFIRNENNEPIAILTVNRDITERVLLTEEIKKNEEKLRLLVEGTPNFFFYTQGIDKYVNYVSPTVEQITGYKPEEWCKKLDWFATNNSINKLAKEYTLKHLNGEITNEPTYLELYHKNGNKVLLEIYENPIIKDGKVIGIQGIATDITDKKRAELIQTIQYNIANAVVTSKTLNELFEIVRKELNTLIDTKNFFIAFYDEKNDMLSSNIDKDEKDEIPVWSAKNSLTGYVIKKKKSFLFSKEDIVSLVNKGEAELIGTLPETWLGVPLIINQKVIGVIAVQDYYNKNAYDKHSLELLEIISKQLSIYIEQKRAEEYIHKLSLAIEQSPSSIIITDIHGNIEYVNQKFCEVSGYCLDEAIGKNPRILKSGKTDSSVYKELWDTITNGKDWEGEFINKKKNGEIYYESVLISPLKNSDGVITNYVAIKEDITEKKKLFDKVIQSEEQFRSIWENSIDAMRLIDEKGVIIDVNEAFCNLFELSKEELIGKTFDVCYANKDNIITKFKQNYSAGKIPKKLEAQIELYNHKRIWIDASNSYINIKNKPLMLLSIFRDIDDKKKMIEELIAAKEKAEEMNRVKSHFFATMSHELRTPFVGIMGFAEMLFDELDNQDHKDMAGRIVQASKRLTNTLNQILDMTKLEFDKQELNITNFDAIQTLDDVYLQFEKSAKLKKIDFKRNLNVPEFYINSDEKLVSEILINLVNNAIKYTEKGTVEIFADKKIINNKKHLVIEIRDTGIGISKDKHDIIWEDFRQASEGTSRKFEGTGLGLSIARRFANLIKANLYLKSSELNVGSIFVLELPLEIENQNGNAPLKIIETVSYQNEVIAEPIISAKKKILFVEDDQMAIDIVNRSLSSLYEIDSVTNSENALKKIDANKQPYDLILMDINLGRDQLDGIQLTELIRKIDNYKNVPIVAFTAYAREEDKNEFLSKGMDYYLSKPFTISDLRNLVKDILNK